MGRIAIAGVINFIMKRNFEGIQFDGQLGQNWHSQHSSFTQGLAASNGITAPTGSIHDGNNRSFNVILGSSIADGRGNVTGYAGYLQANPIPERQPRLWRLPAQRQPERRRGCVYGSVLLGLG